MCGLAVRFCAVISHKHRCIFIHIPKTAGSSIEDVIWPGDRTEADLWMGISNGRNKYQTGGLQHLLARQIFDEVGPASFSRYFKFTIVRNPFDRLVSQYAYTIKHRPDLRQLLGIDADASFSEYVDRIYFEPHVQWRPQTDFILDDDGMSLVDFIGRFERIEADCKTIFDRLGIKAELPVTNKGSRSDYRDYYDKQTKEKVESIYSNDLSAFSYSY